jgi:hypothetical protein
MSLKSDITRPEGVAMNLVLRQALIDIAVAVTVAGLADLCIWMMSRPLINDEVLTLDVAKGIQLLAKRLE